MDHDDEWIAIVRWCIKLILAIFRWCIKLILSHWKNSYKNVGYPIENNIEKLWRII